MEFLREREGKEIGRKFRELREEELALVISRVMVTLMKALGECCAGKVVKS